MDDRPPMPTEPEPLVVKAENRSEITDEHLRVAIVRHTEYGTVSVYVTGYGPEGDTGKMAVEISRRLKMCLDS